MRVGIIGMGIISQSHMEAYKLINMAEIVAVCDIDIFERKSFFEEKNIHCYDDYHLMIKNERLDMVDICLPTYLHKEAAIYALQNDLNVLVEKPMALNVEECEEIANAAHNSKGRIMVAHVSRFKPQSMLLKKIIDNNQLGRPIFFHAWRFSSFPQKRYNNWLLNKELGGGTIFDFQIHDIDLACWYLGTPINFLSKKILGNELGYYISELDFMNGCNALLEISHVMPEKYAFTSGMSMIFENGIVETSFRSDSEGWLEITDKEKKSKYKYSDLSVMYSRNPYGEEIAHFINCIKNNQNFCISIDEAKLAVQTSNNLVLNGESKL